MKEDYIQILHLMVLEWIKQAEIKLMHWPLQGTFKQLLVYCI